MAAGLTFGQPSSFSFWHDDHIALGRVSVAPQGAAPPEPAIWQEASLTVVGDLRMPGMADDAAHGAAGVALRRGRFPHDLDGDFALAAWDGARRALRLARDRLGIRPLYYVPLDDGGLAFASFPEALIAGGFVDGRLRPQGMARVASGDAPPGEKTLIEGVLRLLPGHVLTLGSEGRRLERYWRYPVTAARTVPDDHAAAARLLRTELEAAVRRALPEAGPLAAHLSGGLDSGAVAALAAQAAGDRPRTAYCVTVPARHRHLGAIDEEAKARTVAAATGFELIPVEADVVQSMLQRPLAATYPASLDPEDGYARLLSHAATTGADRVLCGFGGDEVVSNNGRGAILGDFVALRWRALARTAPELRDPLWRMLLRQATAELLPPGLNRRLRRLLGAPPAAERRVEEMLRERYRASARWAPAPPSSVRIQRTRLEGGGFVERLEVQAWEAARHGLRYVFPLLDWRLLEFAAGIPARLQFAGGLRRALFRTAIADLLPREIVAQSIKLAPTPTSLYQLALDREALIAEARRLAGSAAASEVIDLTAVERQLASLPTPEEVAARIRAETAAGRQLHDPRLGVIPALTVARALAANEERRSGETARPEAA